MTIQLFRSGLDAETIATPGTVMRLLADARETNNSYEVVLVEASAGETLAAHRHPWEEMYFVLDGEIEVQVGRRRRVAGPGTFVTLPARCVHAYCVLTASARFLHISLGNGAIDAFRDLEAVVNRDPALSDVDALLEVLDRHRIEVMELPEPLPDADGALGLDR